MNIGYWTEKDDYLKWNVRVNRPGTFKVEVTYACNPNVAGSEYELSAGGESVTGRNAATKGWNDYVTEEIGTIKVDGAGVVEFTVKPTKMPGYAVMNWRKAVLTPVAGGERR